jgi:hypothetical protein
VARIVFDRGADAADMYVDGAVEGFERFPLDGAQQELARQHPARMAREHLQQIELVGRHRPVFPIDACLTGGRVDIEAPEAQDLFGLRIARRQTARAAAGNGAQPRQQLARLERFGEIVVGADLQPDHAVERVAARRQHEHGQIAVRAQAAADVEAVAVGQHEVEHERVETQGVTAPRVEFALGLRGIGRMRHLPAGALQEVADLLGQPEVVFNQQQLAGGGAGLRGHGKSR